MSKANDIWEDYAETEAYFAVSTHDRFRSSNIDDDAKAEFFKSGQQHIDEIWAEIEREFNVEIKPAIALDYGCGVGRLVLPLAKRCANVIGVDISATMLTETKRNAEERGLENVRVQNDVEFWDVDADTYDFVHSYIVLQHIKPVTGYQIVEKIVKRLEKGGCGMLHFTFTDGSSAFRRWRFRIYRDVPGVHAFLNWIRGKSERLMPMYEYDRERVFQILHKNGCRETFVRATDHGFIGAMIFFRKNSD